MRTTTFRRVSCLCALSLMINKHLLHILGIECLLLLLQLHRSTIFNFHNKPSSSSSINIKTSSQRSFTSHQSKSSAHLHQVFTPSHIFHRHFSQRSISFAFFTYTARLFLHATHQDTLSLRILCQFPNSELFSLFLTFLLTGNSNSGLHSTFFPLQTAHSTHSTHLPPFHFTSLHRTSCTRQIFFDNKFLSNRSFDIKFFSNHFFDIKIISNHFFISATTIFPLQRQLFIIKTSQPSSSSFLVFLFNKFIFSTKHEVSALSGYVLNIHHLSSQSLTRKGSKSGFQGRAGILWHINTSTSSTFFISQLNNSEKNAQLSIINIFAICHNSQQKPPTQITALKRESSPPLFSPQHHTSEVFSPLFFTNSSHPHCNKKPLTILFWPSLTTVFFLRADIFHERKVG
jgi:hypothetical protein